MICTIFYVIQFIWYYKHIFIHQLQQHKNNIVVQCSFYYGHNASAVVQQLTTRSPKTADISIPFTLPHTWYCLIHVIIVLCIFICIRQAHNGPKYVKTVSNIWPNSKRSTFLSIKVLQMCLISVIIILNSSQNKL